MATSETVNDLREQLNLVTKFDDQDLVARPDCRSLVDTHSDRHTLPADRSYTHTTVPSSLSDFATLSGEVPGPSSQGTGLSRRGIRDGTLARDRTSPSHTGRVLLQLSSRLPPYSLRVRGGRGLDRDLPFMWELAHRSVGHETRVSNPA